MRRYLLDTSVVSAYLLGRPGAVSLVSPWVRNREAATSIVVYGEVIEYLRGRSDFERRHAELRDLSAEIAPHFLRYPIVTRYSDIRRQLRPPHGPGLIGDIDTLMAATAIERNLTVATIEPDFERVPVSITTSFEPLRGGNLLAHALPGDISSDRVFVDSTTDLGRILDQVRAHVGLSNSLRGHVAFR